MLLAPYCFGVLNLFVSRAQEFVVPIEEAAVVFRSVKATSQPRRLIRVEKVWSDSVPSSGIISKDALMSE